MLSKLLEEFPFQFSFNDADSFDYRSLVHAFSLSLVQLADIERQSWSRFMVNRAVIVVQDGYFANNGDRSAVEGIFP
jgi:hypothetical protein